MPFWSLLPYMAERSILPLVAFFRQRCIGMGQLQALILLPNHLLQMVAKAGSRSFSGGCQVVKRGRFPPTTGGVGEPMRRRKPLSANDEG